MSHFEIVSKYKDHYSASAGINMIIPGIDPGTRIDVNYTATGYWK